MRDSMEAMAEGISAGLTSDQGLANEDSGGWFLGSRAALQCARRTHNDFDPTLTSVELSTIPPSRWVEQGIEFEKRVVDLILRLCESNVVDSRFLSHAEAAAATAQAMAAGTSVIIGGVLPDDPVRHRTGRPDLLIRMSDRQDGRPGYVPVEIKGHRVTRESTAGGAQLSTLKTLTSGVEIRTHADLQSASTYRQRDLMQLAHYWRMLEACDSEAHVSPMGGIIGSDTCTDDDGFIIWQSLTEPLFDTYSRSQGMAKRSALERYDHEFDFRIDVVEVALQQDQPEAPAPLVRPIWIEECDSCPWHDVCLENLGDSDPSVHVTSGRLSIREWNGLRKIGIETVFELSRLELSDSRLETYWSEIDISASRAKSRLENAVLRAQMSLADEEVRWLDNTVHPIPRADLEVDFDLEWDGNNRIYLWGFLVSEGASSRIDSMASWEVMDDADEAELAGAAIDHLVRLRTVAESQGKSFLVYHYSHPEVSMVRRLLATGVNASYSEAWWENFTSECFVDLLPRVKERLFGLKGLGLKAVAKAAGFYWTEEDPSGEQTLEWIDQARSDPDEHERLAARERLLRYNTDDVKATYAVRNWLESNAGKSQ